MIFGEKWNYNNLKNPFFQWTKVTILIVAPILFSFVIYSRYQEQGIPIIITSVQPNFEPHHEKFDIPMSVQLNRFLELSQSCLSNDTDLLLFPETSFGPYDIDRLNTYREIQSLYDLVDNYPNTSLITGLSTYRLYGESNVPEGKDYREYKQQDGSKIYLETQNSAVLLNPDQTYDSYLKSKLVPGAEIFPYKEFLPFLKPLVQKLGGSLSDWGSQKKRSTFDINGIQIAPVICYESVFGEYTGGYIKNGAQVIAVVTNDGWWDNTAGHIQHALFARLRAIEYRRPVIRSANLGWTCFIDQRGNISMQNEYGVMGCIQSEVLANDTITTYARWGDMIARVACFMIILIVLSAWMKKYRS